MTRYREGKAVEDEDSEFSSFSLRIPTSLANQINERRKISKRSKNMEITLLLEKALDAEVERDKELIEAMSRRNSTLGSNQS